MKQPLIDNVESPIAGSMEWFAKQHNPFENADDPSKASIKSHVLSVTKTLNHAFQEKVDAWSYLKPYQHSFGAFFQSVTSLSLDTYRLQPHEQLQILTFLNYAFNGVEVDFVRQEIQKYLSFPIWINLSDHRRDEEFKRVPKLRKVWSVLQKRDSKMSESEKILIDRERTFLVKYCSLFFDVLYSIPSAKTKLVLEQIDQHRIRFCERFIEFLIDLESQLPLRRFFNSVLDHINLVVRCQESELVLRQPDGRLFAQLVDMLRFYTRFEVDDITGEQMSETEIMRYHEQRITHLQLMIFKNFTHLREFALKSVSAVDTRASLVKYMDQLTNEDLFALIKMVHIADESSLSERDKANRRLLLDLIVERYERKTFQRTKINAMPLYPTEGVIWDRNLVPDKYYNYESSLSLPKLNLQFLSVNDYLLRNFVLFRLESTYAIRQDPRGFTDQVEALQQQREDNFFWKPNSDRLLQLSV